MKVAVLFVVVLGISFVSSENSDATAEVLKFERDPNFDGNFHYDVETSNGIKLNQVGTLTKGAAGQNDTITVEGSYSYKSPDGELIEVKYKVDSEHGYQAEGSHLPTPPPIPAAIQKALDYVAAKNKETKPKK